MKKLIPLAFCLSLVCPSFVWALYDYNQVRFMKYNELRAIKNSAIRASRNHPFPKNKRQALQPLEEALKMLFSRPNADNLVEPLIEDLEQELETLSSLETSLQNIVNSSIQTLYDKSLDSNVRITAALCLNNLLLRVKPKTLEKVGVAEIVCKLADKKIKVPRSIQKEFKSLYIESSPSKLARKIMFWYAKKKNFKEASSSTQSCPFSKRKS